MTLQSADTRIDWFRILVQLKDEGYSLYAVEHFTKIPKSTLIGYRNGSQPNYENGERLLQFWRQALAQPAAEPPRVSPFSHKA